MSEEPLPKATILTRIFRSNQGFLLHATNVAYNSFKIHHHEPQSFRGSRGEYDKLWDQWRARFLRESQMIKIEGPALYTKWEAEGTPRLWNTVEGLADWWDNVHRLVDNRISEISNMERPDNPAPKSRVFKHPKTAPDNEQRPLRRLNSQAHANTRQQIQSQISPSTSRREQCKPVTGPVQSPRPSDRGTSHKPKQASISE